MRRTFSIHVCRYSYVRTVHCCDLLHQFLQLLEWIGDYTYPNILRVLLGIMEEYCLEEGD
jgi:hypothetical protein